MEEKGQQRKREGSKAVRKPRVIEWP